MLTQSSTNPDGASPLGARLALSVAVAVAVAVLAGCGGGDDGPTKKEYVAQADAICDAADKKEAPLGAPSPGDREDPKFYDANFQTRFNAISRDALRKLSALESPEDDRAAAGDLTSALEAIIAGLDARIAALRRGDVSGAAATLTNWERGIFNLQSASASLGLTRCQAVGE